MSTTIKEKVTSSLVNEQLPCPVTFKIARELKVSPREVGETANNLGIKIINCQLGCFQVEKATHDDLDRVHISRALAEEIEAALVNNYLPCAVALKVGKKLKVTPKEVGDAATKQNIRIVNCQLGCFP